MCLRGSDQLIEKIQRLKLSQMLWSIFLGKRLPSVGRPCKPKSWFDHNVIIRGYVYLRSFIGARTYMCVNMNSAELHAQSERGISKSSAEKIYM